MPDLPQPVPPDKESREQALDASRSLLVRAPAGSGKTDLLTRRFLLLLGQVDDPRQIVAITFTNAAAAEMRHRILAELEKASLDGPATVNGFSMEMLAQRALARSRTLGWNLIDMPSQLRISTIDSFCREIAQQEPILSGLGGRLDIYEQPDDLYRRAARRTLEQIGGSDTALSNALETLFLWRDNSWNDLEDQLVRMLGRRDQWMHESFLGRDTDWTALREQLERSFMRAVRKRLTALDRTFCELPGALNEAHHLARLACEERGDQSPWDLAECHEIPSAPFSDEGQAYDAFVALAGFLLTKTGSWRSEKGLKSADGFPSTPRGRAGKARFGELVQRLKNIAGLDGSLAAVRSLPSPRYSDEDWEIVQACFRVLRQAAGQLRVVFAETAKADFIEIAQIAQRALKDEDGLPTDAALRFADGIRHLLVDEFQDTSRRQHRLLATLIGAWPDREGRSCFVVGDPMQSIYGFRYADAELFPRVEQRGLEIPGDHPLLFDSVQLVANFRSAPALVRSVNETFAPIFAENDGSGIGFTASEPARDARAQLEPLAFNEPPGRLQLHLQFMPASQHKGRRLSDRERDVLRLQRADSLEKQTAEIVALVQSHLPEIRHAEATGGKYRVAIVGRSRTVLAPVAQALRNQNIAFRAIDLEILRERPEIIDALALTRALVNPEDRSAWLGVLRAPWCGLSLADLHQLTSADDSAVKSRPVPDLLVERSHLLSAEGGMAAARLAHAVTFADRLRSAQPSICLGTWIEQVWLHLGGAHCVDRAARANVDLLWQTMDHLPQGEPDLLGSSLDAALADLKALPDPAASIDCGVQVMTMHGAKGLEFEVVILPDLQARSASNKLEMLSWLERGLPPDAGVTEKTEITEFLVAPFPPKGAERGTTKKWVDDVRRERERQEMRRILYVAATRAREQLHIFARPSYKSGDSGQFVLADPRESLLLTAWPAWQGEVQRRFAQWQAAQVQPAEPNLIDAIAASEEVFEAAAPRAPKPTRMQRLPSNFTPTIDIDEANPEQTLVGAGRLYERHEGGLHSRALGNAVHELLQRLAQHPSAQAPAAARAALGPLLPRFAASLRGLGIDASQADRLAQRALAMVLSAASDPQAQWILAPHADAASEARWTGVVAGSLRTVQVDRVFRAGPAPQAEGDSTWWIVDYKTAHEEGLDPAAALPRLRSMFAPQIEAYARVLRGLHGADATVRGGLYYPRMAQFDWWEL